MKKFLSIAIIAATVVSACSSQTAQEKSSEANVVKDENAAAQNTAGQTVHLSKQDFLDQIMDYEKNPNEWIYKGELPGLIDFYADWCRPCKITSPILEDLAVEYAGKIKVYKIDIQVEKELAAVFGIQSIPTFLFIPKGNQPVMSSGIAQTPEATKEMFRTQIDEILLNKTN
jgi:thioredoxin